MNFHRSQAEGCGYPEFSGYREAIKNFPDDLKGGYPETDWKKIAWFRDVLTRVYLGYGYNSGDNSMNILPNLKKEIQHILRDKEKYP